MAFLGHTARVIISTATIVASTEMWTALGFTVQESEPGFARLTDGQVLVTLIEDAFPSPALAYFHPDPVSLSRELQGMGLTLREESESGFAVTPVDGLDVYIHRRSQDNAERHSGAVNPLLGYLDAFSLGVEDAAAARRRAEELGFFVQEEWGMPQPRSDVTDGLITIAFHQRTAAPYLAYNVEITPDLVDELTAIDGLTVDVTEIAGEIAYVRLTTTEGTKIVLLHDNNYE